MLIRKILNGFTVGAILTVMAAHAEWTPPTLSTWDDLDTLVSGEYSSMTNYACIYPPFFSFGLYAGFFAFAPEDEIATVTNLFTAGNILGVPVWKIHVTETQTTERVWLLYGESANEPFRTNAVPANFDPIQWVEDSYGTPPAWLTGEDVDQWYKWRDRSRMHLEMTLIATNDWPVFLEAIRIAATNNPAPEMPPPTLPADTNRLAFAGIEQCGSQAIRLWLYSPPDQAPIDLFGSNILPPPSNRWSIIGSIPAGDPFSAWDEPITGGRAFFQAARNDVDSDGDGIPDGREMLAYGTRTDTSDTDGDGISDREELYRYETNPDAIDSDGDGLSDDEEVAAGLNPNLDDSDFDGLKDCEELYVYFTNPKDPDYDNDGISDGDEILVHNTSPFSTDTDDDGVTDDDEIGASMSPLLVDSDSDGIDDYTDLHTSFLSPTDGSDAGNDEDDDDFSNLNEYSDLWSMTVDAYSNAAPRFVFVTRWPGLNNIRRRAATYGADLNCLVLGDAGQASALLRIPPTKQINASMVKQLYHTSPSGFFLNGTPLSSLPSPISVPDSSGTAEYRLTAIPSAQGTLAEVWLTDDQGQNSTMHLNCRVPKMTQARIEAQQSANYKIVSFGQTGELFVPWEPGLYEQTHVHVDPSYDHTGLSGIPYLPNRSYSLARVSGEATNYTASLNKNAYYSAWKGRRGLPLPIGHHQVTAGFDFNLDGELATEESSLSCDVYVVKVDFGIKRRNGDVVPDAIEQSSGSVLQLTSLTNTLGSYLSLTEPTVAPSDALNRLTYKFKTWTPTYCHGAIRLYRNGVLFMNAGAAETNVAPSALSATWTLDATVGGIVDLSLVAYDPAGREVTRDTVRINAIPCEPADGRILYVRPDSTTPTPPYDSFDKHAAHKIGDAVRFMEQGDNVLVSPYGPVYQEYDIQITKGGVIAGLGGQWTVVNPSTNTTPLAESFDYTYLPEIQPGSTNANSMFRVDCSGGESGQLSVSGFRLRHGVANQTPGWGGAIYADSKSSSLCISHLYFDDNRATELGGAVFSRYMSDIIFDTCVFKNNLCEYDDGGNACFTKGMGGAIASICSTMTITNCILEQNAARVVKAGGNPTSGSAGGGGDIYNYFGTLKLIMSVSKGAKAGYAKEALPLTPSDSKTYFTGDGGSLLVHGDKDNTSIEIRDCRFEDSISYGNGGAISLSYDSSPEARTYFVLGWPSLQFPPATATPNELGGGCVGSVSNVVFKRSQGGWQGGAISANGRGMSLNIADSVFDECKGGTTHLRDGKGGAVAIGGGLQADASPMSDILVARCIINSCSASGNGGGIYVTIRGKLRVLDTTIDSCSAKNSGQGEPLPSNDYRVSEGMGGGIHVSAGGYVYFDSENSLGTQILWCNAAVSGGGFSVKSGRAFIQGAIAIQGNTADGASADGYGNGGGVFVTTSYYDDNPPFGAGWGAATLYNEDGFLSSTIFGVTVTGNRANRWGGGVYAGISPPWYGSVPPKNLDAAMITFKYAAVQGNVAFRAANISSFKPAQIAAERIQGDAAVLAFDGTTVSGNGTTDIGIYAWDSIEPTMVGTVFGTLAVTNILEVP